MQKPADKNALSLASHLAFKTLNQDDRLIILNQLKNSSISLLEFRDRCYKTICKYQVLKVQIEEVQKKGLIEKAEEADFLVS